MNNCWQILQIEPTADEKAIKKAYAVLLKHNKPDKNPQGFQQLQEAYETALNERYWYADDEDDDEYDSDDDFAENIADDMLDKVAIDKTVIDNQNFAPPISSTIEPISYAYAPVHQVANATTDVNHEDGFNEDNFVEDTEATEEDFDSFDDENLPRWTAIWHNQNDHELVKTLVAQFGELNEQSFDFVHDYEVALLQFLAYQEPIFPQSYQTSFDYFAWQNYLNSWQIDNYPWFYLKQLDDNYQDFGKFSQQNIGMILAVNYPHIYKSWDLDRFNRFEFLKNLNSLPQLAHELSQLNADIDRATRHYLSYTSHNHVLDTLNNLQQDAKLKQLNAWVFDKVFGVKTIALLIAVFAILTVIGGLVFGDWVYVYSNLGLLLIGVLVWFGFWQMVFWFLARPDKFTLDLSDPELYRGLLGASSLVFIGFYGKWGNQADNWATSLHQSGYYFAHIAGMLAWGLLVYAEQQKILPNTLLTASRAFTLMVVALGVPLFAMSIGLAGKNEFMTIMAISPWIWWIYALPSIAYRFKIFNHEFIIRLLYVVHRFVGFFLGAFLLILLLNLHLVGYGLAGVGLFLIGLVHAYWIRTDKFL